MIKLLFIRHGATEGNLQKCYIGRTDEPLCDLGIAQMEKLRVQHFRVDHLFVSPALRTRQTAGILFPNMPYAIVDDLMETDFGVFEGKNAKELSDESAYRAWVDSNCLAPIPSGECISDFKQRCCAAFSATMEAIPDNDSVAFVIHGGSIMAILEEYAKPPRSFYDYHIANGRYVQCEFDNGTIQIAHESNHS